MSEATPTELDEVVSLLRELRDAVLVRAVAAERELVDARVEIERLRLGYEESRRKYNREAQARSRANRKKAQINEL